MPVLRTTTTKMGITISQMTWPENAMTFDYSSPALGGNFRGTIDPVPRAGWKITVFNPSAKLTPTVEGHTTKNLNEAVTYLENHIRTAEKNHQDSIERTAKQEYQQSREVHALFTPKE